MQVFDSIEKLKEVEKPLHLAIGMFDGIHIGHQAVIQACLHAAKNTGGKSGVLTFWPHPSKIIRPDNPVPQIMPLESKVWMLEHLSLDYCIIQPFQSDFSKIEACKFVSYLKTQAPTLQTLFVGENFRFGRGRTGDIELFRKLALEQDVHVVSMQQLKYDGEVISSTRIRALLKRGNFNDIRLLLGHPYTVIGKTKKGRQVGRSIGYPTLNIEWSPELKPPYGVYAVKLICNGKDRLEKPQIGIANYGIRPTYNLESNDPILEVHLFEQTNIGYETDVAVEMISFIRTEQKFDSQEALVKQIGEDVKKAKSSF